MSSEPIETEKQKEIAQAAFHVFSEHGYRKTSMQLIAERAGMSRPALYLHFQSKEDVFAFLSISFFSKVAESIKAILAKSGPPAEVLYAFFDAFDPDGVMAHLLDAKHGNDLLEAKVAGAQDEIAKIENAIKQSLTEWLAREAKLGCVNCEEPELTAQTILSSYFGLKNPVPSYAVYKSRVAELAHLLGKGLAV